jgi:hypothetical protein
MIQWCIRLDKVSQTTLVVTFMTLGIRATIYSSKRRPVLGQNESIGPVMELVHRDSPALIAAIGTSRTGLFYCW